MTNALELQGVHAAYERIDVLYGVDLAVPAGSIFALLGPNGAGKSTLLKVAAGLHPPTRGDIVLGGRCVTGANPVELARRGVCLIPEGSGVFPNLTVDENLRMMTFTGRPLGEIQEQAYARFPRLLERRNQAAGTMSGGEQQMLALARALATDPAVLLIDELSMGLAPLVVRELYELVADIARAGVSVLLVEQFATTVLGIADQASVMIHGRIALTGAADESLLAKLSELYLGAPAPAS